MSNRPNRRQRVFLYDQPLPEQVESSTPVRLKRPEDGGLSRREMDFCRLMAQGFTRAYAAEQAGYSLVRAAFIANTLLREQRIKRQILAFETEALLSIRFNIREHIARDVQLAQANVATELMEVWIPPCRYCWGINFEYQRTHAEFQEAFEAWIRLPETRQRRQPVYADLGYGEIRVYDDGGSKVPFDQKGGDGYDTSQPPNPACPNCRGRGLEVPGIGSIPHVKWKDSRDYSAAGRAMFAGAEQTPRGLKMIVRSQDQAKSRLNNILIRYLEFQAEQAKAGYNTRQGAVGLEADLDRGIAGLLTDDPRSYSDEELDAVLASYGVSVDALTGEDGEGTDSSADNGET